MDYHPVVQKIRSLLDERQAPYKFFEHEAVRTSEDAHKLRPDYEMSQGAKALIIKAKITASQRVFLMCVIPADLRLDGNKVREIAGAKSTSFATKEESDLLTDSVEFGGIPPFGNLFGIQVYLDPKIKKHEEILFNCGDRRATIAMKLADYIDIVKPIEADVTE